MLNTSSGQGATVGGGSINTSSGVRAAVGGGIGNISSGSYGTVPGGYFNSASGLFSFAAGRSANAIHDGSFVWADSQNNYFASTAINQLSVRAAGGVRLSDDTPSISFGSQTRQMLNLWGTTYGIGVQADTLYFRCDTNSGNAFAGFRWYRGGTHHDGNGNAGGGTELMSLGSTYLYVNGTFISSSDRNKKENFAPIQPREVLEKVVALPITRWSYKSDGDTSHLGPVAQDFHAAFGLGTDDKHIATVDADGVALAAIQGLNQKVEQQLEQKEKEMTELKKKNAALETRLGALEKLMNRPGVAPGGAK